MQRRTASSAVDLLGSRAGQVEVQVEVPAVPGGVPDGVAAVSEPTDVGDGVQPLGGPVGD